MRKPSKTVPRAELDAAERERDLLRVMVSILGREEPSLEMKYQDEGRTSRLRLYRAMAPCGGYVLSLATTSTSVNVRAYYLEDLHLDVTKCGNGSPFYEAVYRLWHARAKLYQEGAGS